MGSTAPYAGRPERRQRHARLVIRSTVCSPCLFFRRITVPTLVSQIDALDIYLPLLADSSTQVCIAIAQLLASSLRVRTYRLAVSEWLPQSERHKEVKGKRGWEKTESVKSPSRSGGWAARQLSVLLHRKDVKVFIYSDGWAPLVLIYMRIRYKKPLSLL